MKKWEKRWREIQGSVRHIPIDDWTMDAVIDRMFDDLPLDARTTDSTTAPKMVRIGALAAELGRCLEEAGPLLTSRFGHTIGPLPPEELVHVAADHLIGIESLSAILRRSGVLPPRIPTEVCSAPDCVVEVSLERDEGSVYALPDGWSYVEKGTGTDVFLPCCPNHADMEGGT